MFMVALHRNGGSTDPLTHWPTPHPPCRYSTESGQAAADDDTRVHREIPVWIQTLYPDRGDSGPAVCTDAYLVHAIRAGLCIYGARHEHETLEDLEDQFVHDPLAFAEVYGQVVSWFALSHHYLSDRNATGADIEDMSNPAASPVLGVIATDCEDTSSAIMDIASRLYFRACRNRNEADTDPLVKALLQIAMLYIPVIHDSVTTSGSRKLHSRGRPDKQQNQNDGRYETKSHEWEEAGLFMSTPEQAQERGATLHVFVRLYPAWLIAERLVKEAPPRLAEFLQMVGTRVPERDARDKLRVLHIESTDRGLCDKTSSDTVTRRLQISHVVDGHDQYRTLCDFQAIASMDFYKVVLRGYSTVLFLETGSARHLRSLWVLFFFLTALSQASRPSYARTRPRRTTTGPPSDTSPCHTTATSTPTSGTMSSSIRAPPRRRTSCVSPSPTGSNAWYPRPSTSRPPIPDCPPSG